MADARVIHFEIVGKDGAALQRYDADLFGWKLDEQPSRRLRHDRPVLDRPGRGHRLRRPTARAGTSRVT